ncbi:uncharacterized protein LOC6537694 [Drosophila yakuba]|uniref:Uncharacterized protein n=1 Tax=Drosophila yakuba TaxID=7245 RepID=B4PLK2_DROYA|nr:uncharacterized protein LOC6537694 [Drosophila yakuba]EDW97951.1 uncharacterized protein Dyak_GE10267 [Drosophila yakuba]
MCVRSSQGSVILIYFVVLLHLVTVVLAQNEGNMSETTVATGEECGSTQKMVDECFKDLPPHLMDFLQNTKIVISKKEITAKCNIFNRGMRCFDTYSKRCLDDRKLGTFKNNVEGARRFFYKFCGDADFQRDYLRHKDCFAYIQLDWVTCTSEFENILSEEVHDERRNASEKFLEFCCARYAYENCIYNSARYKCYKNSAEFARETAKMLSDEKHFRNCAVLQNICAHDSGMALAQWHWMCFRLAMATPMMLLLMRLVGQGIWT